MQRPRRPMQLLLLVALQAMAVVNGATVAKRSLSALARTSQLPHSSTSPVDQAGHDQDHGHGGHSPGQHDKRAELQEEAIREELLRQRAAPASEAFLSAIMAADQYGSDLNGVEDKRSVSSLARHGNLPAPMEDSKRSLSSLARYGNLPAQADQQDKRSLSSLARYGNLPAAPTEDKRSLSSLARYGNLPVALEEAKRSLASLARYGNLPAAPADKRSLEALARGGLLSKSSRVDNSKRSLSSLARLGELPKRWMPPHQREQAQDLLDTMQRELDETKRSLSSLARAGDLSRAASLYDDQDKRSVESLARTWSLPKRVYGYGPYDEEDEYDAWGKRNAAALLRQTHFSTQGSGDDVQRDDDQHGQGRRKRSLWDEDLMSGEVAPPYVQSTSGQEQDWEPMWSPTAWGAYLGYGDDSGASLQKRFLGSVARSWGPSAWRPASPASAAASGASPEDAGDGASAFGVSKRHIGALARIGMLPAYRSLRYARSGRAVASDTDEDAEGAGPGRVPSLPGRLYGKLSGRAPFGKGPVRYRRVCYYREDPEYGPPPTKD